MSDAPPEVVALAQARAEARAAREFATADQLRDEIASAGWLVRDTPDGYALTPRPAYDVAASVADLPDRSAAPDTHRATLALVVDGWPEDVVRCVESVLQHGPADLRVLLLDNGDVDGVGAAVHALATAAPGRVEALHLAAPAGWAAARTALVRADTATIHLWAEPSVELTGDAISPLVETVLADDRVAEAGPYGVELAADLLSFHDAQAGDVDALNAYLVAFRRAALLAVGGPHPRARYYRNADLELSIALRDEGWRVVMTPPVPLTLHRHRGYHDVDPAYRDRESRRTYDRLLQRLRGRRS